MIDKRLMYRYGGDTMGGKNDKSKSSPGPDRSKVSAQQERNQRDIVAGMAKGSEGTLSDPREKQDYVGETIFGPTQKYTGGNSFFGGANRYGYQNQYIDPTKANFGQVKPGYGGRVLGGILGLLTGIPFIGGAIGRAYDKGLGMFRNKFYDDMSQYNRLGLFGVDPVLTDNYSNMKISDTSFSPTNQPFNYMFDINKTNQMIENARSLPGNNLRTEVTNMDLQKFKQPMTQTMDYDTYITINPESTITPYEFEQLKQGNITQPGTYIG